MGREVSELIALGQTCAGVIRTVLRTQGSTAEHHQQEEQNSNDKELITRLC